MSSGLSTVESSYGRHFDRLAPDYESLRMLPTRSEIQRFAELGDLAGRCVLDLGCGTGRIADALARQHHAQVVGADRSIEMLKVARPSLPAGVRLVRARAEYLPFPQGAFERVLMHMTVHLVNRPKTFSEVRRVLNPNGMFVIVTLNPIAIEDYWLASLFPSYASIERTRFKPIDELTDELGAAGFVSIRWERSESRGACSRDQALRMLRGRFASSLALIGEEEFENGLARAERDLPERVEGAVPIATILARVCKGLTSEPKGG